MPIPAVSRGEGMFRKVLIRFGVGFLLLASVTVLATASGSSAVSFVSAAPFPSHDGGTPTHDCPGAGVNERHYCLVVTTYNNLAKFGGVEVDLTLQNYDQSSLTNPAASLTWTAAAVSFVSSTGPASCLPVAPSSPNVGQINCSFPNLPGVGSASDLSSQRPCITPVPPPSGPICSTVKLYFTADSSDPVVHFNATADVKESNPQNGANLDRQFVDDAPMTFDSNITEADKNADATVALPKAPFNKPRLHTTLGNAFLDFFSGSSPAFIAQFAASPGVACVLGVPCTGLDLNTDLSGAAGGTFSSTNQILWTADVASTNTNIVAVHTYDSVSLTSSAPNTLTAAGTRFASCDGVSFSPDGTPSGLTAGQAYFVIKATTNGTISTSFQVASSTTGKPISFDGNGPFLGSCVRIIGDKSSESTKACSASNPPKASDPPAAPKTPPLLCVAKVPNTNPGTVRAYLWDDANGHVGY